MQGGGGGGWDREVGRVGVGREGGFIQDHFLNSSELSERIWLLKFSNNY